MAASNSGSFGKQLRYFFGQQELFIKDSQIIFWGSKFNNLGS
jgi:hypothetical protein